MGAMTRRSYGLPGAFPAPVPRPGVARWVPGRHTGGMLLVGTADGVVELALDGREVRRAQPDTEITALSGDWAIAGDRLLALDTGATVELPEGLQPRCVLALGGGRALVGTDHARLVEVGGPSGPVLDTDFDAIPARAFWSTPWGGPPDTRSLAASPAGTFAGVHVGGVWRRGADGWTEVVRSEVDDHQVAAVGATVAVAAAVGVGQSDDGGETWAWSDRGLHGSYCRSVAISDGWVLAGASTGPGDRQSAVYRRPLDDPERPFELCGGELPHRFAHHIDTGALVAAGALAAIGAPTGEVYVSEDAGATWRCLTDNLPGVHCIDLAG